MICETRTTFCPDAQEGHLLNGGDANIRLFTGLRESGADWIGIVKEQMKDLRENHPALLEHIRATCRLESGSKDWVIYRILPPDWSGKFF